MVTNSSNALARTRKKGFFVGFTAVGFEAIDDIPQPADFDNNGNADIAMFRPSNGTWYLNRSMAGFFGIQFGSANDKSVPNAFVP